jgi:hypothetical protein
MPEEQQAVEIVVCLGSSCFARGNADNLAILKECAASDPSLRLTGSLCQDHCRKSPNLRIAGRVHHGVTPAHLHNLLAHLHEPWDECWSLSPALESNLPIQPWQPAAEDTGRGANSAD